MIWPFWDDSGRLGGRGFSNQLAGNDSAGQFFGDVAGASASIRSLHCVARRTMDQVPYSVENYEGPTVRI